MFINNVSFLPIKLYKCSESEAKKIMKHGIEPIGRENEKVLFSNTEKLKSVLKDIKKGG